jgi:hypothetical protein
MSETAPSIRDSITSAFNGTTAPETTSPAAPDATPQPGSESIPDHKASDPLAKEGSIPSGGDPNKPDAEVQAETPTDPDAPKLEAKPEAPKVPAQKIPPGFPDVKAWEGMPAHVKGWIKNREAQFNQGMSQHVEAGKFGNAAWQAMRPYEAALRASGANPVKLIEEFAATHFLLMMGSPQQKKEAILRAAQRHNVDLSIELEQQPQQANPEVAQLRQQLSQMQSYLHGTQQQQSEVQQQQAFAEVDKFVSDPQRKHIDVLWPKMADLIDKGEARSLADAYEQALWSRPDTRAIQMEEDAARRQAEARNANSQRTGLNGSPIAGSAAVPGESIRASLERAFDQQRL